MHGVTPFEVGFLVARLALGCWLLWRLDGPPSASAGPGRPTATVIVPARDEAAALPGALAAVTGQLRPGDEVVVVDDHSSDATAAVAARAGATVVAARELPPGWTGKAWACATGAKAATGDVLCFVDADTTLAPGALDRVVGDQAAGGGMVSAAPYHRVVRADERLSAVFNVVALMGTDAHTPLGRRRSPNGAYGPVLVVAADDYAELGGHEAVAAEVLDDVRLGQRWRRSGRPVRLYAGEELSSYRMYPGGLPALVEGWTKNFAAGAGAARPSTLVLIALWLSLPLEAVWRLARLALPGPHAGGVALAAGIYALVAAQLWWMLRRVGSFGLATAVLFPLPLLTFVAVFAWSVVLTVARRPVRWKGRSVAPPGRRR